MREFVPLDIYKTSQARMVDQGLTPEVAAHIWNTKILWLITMHKDDIKKVKTGPPIVCKVVIVVLFQLHFSFFEELSFLFLFSQCL
jgi:hypothetical protein